MGWDGANRRKNKRYGIKSSTVHYRKGFLPFMGTRSEPLLLLNVSKSGCHFMTRESLPLEQKLALKIEAPQLSSALNVQARVTWIKASSQAKGMYRVGLEFSRVSPTARKKLKQLLDNAVLENVEITTRVYMKELEKL